MLAQRFRIREFLTEKFLFNRVFFLKLVDNFVQIDLWF